MQIQATRFRMMMQIPQKKKTPAKTIRVRELPIRQESAFRKELRIIPANARKITLGKTISAMQIQEFQTAQVFRNMQAGTVFRA